MAEAEAGRTVVHLKCDDPLVLGRANEELEVLLDHGIAFEVVPGVTAALAAGAYAGIPLTHRDHASAVALVTGQETREQTESWVDFDALARFPGTIVVDLGVTSAHQWMQRLLAAGLAPESPVAVVGRCSWPDQQVLRCRLDELADAMTPASRFPLPAIAIVGSVSRLGPTPGWFQRRPLFGRRILITRPRHQAAVLENPLRELGAEVLVQPAIEITDPADWSVVDRTLHRLQEFDYLVFSSANGVQRLLNRLLALGYDTRVLGRLKLAAMGPGTAEALSSFHLRADLLPAHDYRAEGLLQTLRQTAVGQRFLLARASRGRELLAAGLLAAGAHVEQIVVYDSRDVLQADPSITEQLEKQQIDWVTVTSSAIAGIVGPAVRDAVEADAVGEYQSGHVGDVTPAGLGATDRGDVLHDGGCHWCHPAGCSGLPASGHSDAFLTVFPHCRSASPQRW